jgi:excisionase family DNA binding protein
MNPDASSPYMEAAETVDYLRLHSLNMLYRLIKQHRLPFCRRGKKYLFDRRELDAWLRGYDSSLEQARARRRSA